MKTVLVLALVVLFVLFCSAEAKHSTRHAKVLILGAGVSGINAAKTLVSEHELDFLILEGEDHIGGRIHSGPAGKRYPLGAGQICTAGQKDALCGMSNLMRSLNDHNDIVIRAPGMVNPTDMWSQLKSASKHVEKKIKEMNKCKNIDVPLRSTLGMAGWKPSSRIENALEFHQYDAINGVPTNLLSSKYHKTADVDVDYTVTDPKGFESLLTKMAKPFSKKIILNTIVSEIHHNDAGVTVITSKGVKYTADYVLITFSPGVLTSKTVKFIPALPTWKMEALSLRPMSFLCKIYLQFKRKFWESKTHILFAQTRAGDHSHWQYFDKKHHISKYSTLLLTLTGDHCLESEELTDKQVIDKAFTALKEVYGINATLPTGIARKTWSKNKMTLGSIPYPAVGSTDTDAKWLKTPVGRLWFAGDYTFNEVGSVLNAHNSGIKTSQKLIDCMKKRKCMRKSERCPSKKA